MCCSITFPSGPRSSLRSKRPTYLQRTADITLQEYTAKKGVMVTNAQLDQTCINTIRTLSMDAVQQANSG
ncbi:MAG: hypothetical protein OEW13_07200, partial [Nitrospira sp.]|nr:hypothetical protein [Nitrospira sp.]